MKNARRDDANLLKLIKIAKVAVDDRQRHLADLETAKQSATASLDWLGQSVRSEEEAFSNAGGSDVVSLAAFRNGSAEKRQALEATITTLVCEIEEARDTLRDAQTELQKLEHLVELRQRADRKKDAKKEAAQIDEVALRIAQ